MGAGCGRLPQGGIAVTALQEQCVRLRQASRVLALADASAKNRALLAMAVYIFGAVKTILSRRKDPPAEN